MHISNTDISFAAVVVFVSFFVFNSRNEKKRKEKKRKEKKRKE